ncbi:hypothetical protein AgCh_024029 [Apium graveolens]
MSIVDVDAPQNATWIDRYLCIIEFAGIIVWILHQSENNDGSTHTDFIPESEPAMSPAIERAVSGMSSPRSNSEFYKNAKSLDVGVYVEE